MVKLLKLLGALVLITAAVVVVAGMVAVVAYRGVPKIEVTSRCANPIIIPDEVRVVPAIPATIPRDASVTIPAVSGTGTYALYQDGEGIFLRLPRSLPVLGDTIQVGGAEIRIEATFDGRPVTVPMSEQLESRQRYLLVLCP